jgi:hypothetical protein
MSSTSGTTQGCYRINVAAFKLVKVLRMMDFQTSQKAQETYFYHRLKRNLMLISSLE